MRNIFLMVYFVLSVTYSSAQWNRFSDTHSIDIYTIHLSGQNIYAGSDSLIYVSTNNGQDWTTHAILPERSVSIMDIIRVNDILYAGTNGDGVFKSQDNGQTWMPFNDGLKDYGYSAVCFLHSGENLFLGTGGGGVYIRRLNSGTPWEEYSTGLPSLYAWTINALAVSGSTLIAGAGASGFFYLRPNGSAEWTEKTLDPFKKPDINALISIGDSVFAATDRGVYRSLDKGNSWDSVGIYPMPVSVTHIAYSNNRVYAVYARGNDFFIWYSGDMGKTWTSQDHQFASLYDFAVYDNKFWVATNDGVWNYELQTSSIGTNHNTFRLSLDQNYPNPFNPLTTIAFTLGEESPVKLSVYNILGKEVSTLLDKKIDIGEHKILFDASGLPSGVYFYQLTTGSFRETKKMIVQK